MAWGEPDVTLVLLLSAVAAASAALTVSGHYRGHRALVWTCKPLATGSILAVAAVAAAAHPERLALAVVAGLAFSLAGDVLLMLPRERFRAGLACFLAAHVCYLVAFTSDAPLGHPLAPFLAWALAGAILLRLLWPGLALRLRLPVLLYVGVLLTMAAQTASRAMTLGGTSPLAAALGATLFAASDALLAIDRFRSPFRSARALVRICYFTGQWLIALSAFPTLPLP